MDVSREYIYNAGDLVLLMCDHYEAETPIIHEHCSNVTLFPMGDGLLIDAILGNLLDQGLYNVVLCGRDIDEVVEYVQATYYQQVMNIAVFRIIGDCIGDVFREMDTYGLEIRDALVMYANTYIADGLRELITMHRESRGRNIATVLVNENGSSDPQMHVYAIADNEVLFYQHLGSRREHIEPSDLYGDLKRGRSVNLDIKSSGPTIAVVSGLGMGIFTDNFDYCTIGDLMEGVLASKLYDNVFKVYRSHELGHTSRRSMREQQPGAIDRFFSSGGRTNHQAKNDVVGGYSKEVLTYHDYYGLEHDLKSVADREEELRSGLYIEFPRKKDLARQKGDVIDTMKTFSGYADRVSAELLNVVGAEGWHDLESKLRTRKKRKAKRKSHYREEKHAFESALCYESVSITAECYAFSGVGEDFYTEEAHTVCTIGETTTVDGYMVETTYTIASEEFKDGELHFEVVIDESSDGNLEETQSFFNNVHTILHKHAASPNFYDRDIYEVGKQISLLRIVWNASHREVIEAFGYFFVDMLSIVNLEDSMSRASVFFTILAPCIMTRQDEELLMETIYNNVYNYEPNLKVQILFNYGFLLIQENIVDKSVVKKYNKLYKAGNL